MVKIPYQSILPISMFGKSRWHLVLEILRNGAILKVTFEAHFTLGNGFGYLTGMSEASGSASLDGLRL